MPSTPAYILLHSDVNWVYELLVMSTWSTFKCTLRKRSWIHIKTFFINVSEGTNQQAEFLKILFSNACKCDWIYGNHSKLRIGSYEIIDLKILKHYNSPRIVDHFTVFESFPSTYCCSLKFPPNEIKKLAGWTCKVVSGMLHWVGGRGWTGGKGYSSKLW